MKGCSSRSNLTQSTIPKTKQFLTLKQQFKMFNFNLYMRQENKPFIGMSSDDKFYFYLGCNERKMYLTVKKKKGIRQKVVAL